MRRRRSSSLRSHARYAAFVVAVIVAVASASAGAVAQAADQSWRIGVVLSSSAGSVLGAQQAQLARRSALAVSDTGVFGSPIEVLVRDDGGDPRRAEAAASELVEAGVVALVCCTSVAASERVALLAGRAGVPLLALDGAAGASNGWTLAMRADARTQLTAIAVDASAAGRSSLALMTTDNGFGEASAAAFERALADTSRTLVADVRYDPGARVLTPEALLAATRQPGAIVVWGGSTDTALALDGLRRRGWLGPAFVRPEALAPTAWSRVVLGGLATVGPATRTDPWAAVSSVVAPVSVAEALPDDHPNRPAAVSALARIDASVGRVSPLQRAELALVDDAFQLLQRAFEQVAALGLPAPLDDASVRQAVLDALLSAPPQALAAGTYQARAGDARLARWQGLVPVSTR